MSYTNTGSQTQVAGCPVSRAPNEPLSSVSDNTTIVSYIPSMVLGTNPVGSTLQMVYTFFANGTVQILDARGNSFALAPLTGLPSGKSTTTLLANSTTAVETYLVGTAPDPLANVSVTYSVRHQSCQPAGLEMTISGQVNWGAGGNGTLAIPFSKQPLFVSGSTVWFGNSSGVSLGLDWSNSQQFSPVLSESKGELTYNVGKTFSIDPSIVSSTKDPHAIEGVTDRKIVYATGLYWMFYNNDTFGTTGANLVYATSGNGVTWSPPTAFRSISSGGGSDTAAGFSVWYGGGYFYYALDDGSVYFRRGTLSSSGSISWSASEQTVSSSGSSGSFSSAFVAADSNGHAWVAYLGTSSGSTYPYVSESSTTDGTWSTATGFPVQLSTTSSSWTVEALPLTSGKMAFLWATSQLWIRTWSGSAMNTATQVSSSVGGTGALFSYSALAQGDVTEMAYRDGSSGNLDYQNYSYSSGLSAVKAMSATWGDAGSAPVLSSDGSNYWVTYYSSVSPTTSISYRNYTASSHRWSSAQTFVTDTTAPKSSNDITGILSDYAGLDAIAYETGSTSPYTIKFATLPLTVSTASSSPDPWSKPGISPYESYFSGETEYVSPGNGLLGIEQNDLNVQGRGLNLALTRVFSTPYAFASSSPYSYDNFTLTNLGIGWALNFPWMGTSYLHLSDGQAYPYAWTGNVFQYNGGSSFMLANNGNGYTLYLPDGTQYQFNTARQLTSITDHTGNNTISFTYGSNSYISQITDTISRTYTFSYNSNNTLSSVSSGGRAVYYYYSGSHLSTVKDAAGRPTKYQYSTGTNNWLVSAVIYPTGGKTQYTYGSSSVSVDLKTYYVTSRNIYSSSTALSQSDSISYRVVNNNVIWSNETESNSTAKVGYLDNYFQNGYKSLSRVYDVTSANVTTKVTEYDYDTAGRINDTQILYPAASNDLAGYWNLDEGSGTTAHDGSGNGNIGTLQNSPAWLTSHCESKDCLSFTGSSSQYVNVPSSSSLSPEAGSSGAITLSAWVNVTSSGTGVIIAKYGSSGDEYALSLSSGGGGVIYPVMKVYTSGGAVVCTAQNSATGLTTNQWQLVAGVYSAAAQTCSVYLNGASLATGIASGTASSTSSPVTIGGTATSSYFTGKIDDVRIYSVALSTAQIETIFTSLRVQLFQSLASSVASYDNWGNEVYAQDNVGQQTFSSYADASSQNSFAQLPYGLIGYWTLDEGTGTSAYDYTGIGNTGTLQGTNTWTTSGCRLGNCLALGSGGKITFPSAISAYPLSLSIWVKFSTAPGSGSSLGVAYFGSPAKVDITNNAGTVQAALNLGSVGTATSPLALSTNTWYLLTVVLTSTSGTIYVNGANSATKVGTISSPTSFGLGYDGGTTCSCTLDDARYFARTLSLPEISEIYTGMGFSNSFYTGDGILTSPSNGLAAYLPLNEGLGTTVGDLSGNGNVGTLTNYPSYAWWSGSGCKYGTCLNLPSGKNAYVTVPASPSIDFPTTTTSFSISVWVYISSAGDSVLVAKGGWCGAGATTGYALSVSAGNIVKGCLTSGGTIEGSATGTTTITTGAWHNIVFVDNAGALTLYVDGSSYATATATAASIGGSSALTIGSDGTAHYLTGSIQEVRIYDYALSSSQASSLHSASSPPAMSGIHSAIVGQAQWQNGQGTSAVPQESYYQYDSRGNRLQQKQLHNGAWLDTGYAYDTYGNLVSTTNPAGATTYYHYSSTYSHAYLTATSTVVPGFSNLALDGSGKCGVADTSGGPNTCAITLSVSHPNDLFIVAETSGDATNAPSDSSSLAWTQRATVAYASSAHETEYYATWSSYGSVIITCKFGLGTTKSACNAFAISGSNTASPFDSGSGIPATSSGSSTTPTTTITTSNANDLIVGLEGHVNAGTVSAGSCCRLIQTQNQGGGRTQSSESDLVSSTQSGLTVSFGIGTSNSWGIIADAVVAQQNVTQSYTYSSTTGYMLSQTDGNGFTTSYSFDNLGRTTQVTEPAVGGVSPTTNYVYNDTGNYVTTTDPNGNVVKQYYDGLARLTSTKIYNGTTLYSTESFTYNWMNKIATDTLPSTSVYTYTYDQDGRQVKVLNPDTTYSTTSYNTVANTKTATDANGHQIVYTYDWNGNFLSVKQYYSSTGYYTTSYTYDLSGNMLTSADANGATTTYKYDDLNRLVKTTYPDTTYQTQSYNSVGELVGEVNAGGTQLNYTYDAINRLTQVSYPGGSTLKYTYDGNGNVLTLVNSAVSTYYTYDALGRVTNQTQVVSSHKYTALYGYDKNSNVKSMVYPDSTNITMKYDFLNRITKVGSTLATFTYTTDSMVSTITYGSGETTTYSYNNMDRPTQIDLKSSLGVKRLDLNYTYDNFGNVKTINSESYGYNWLNELTSSSGAWGSITYAYDKAGNQVNQTIGGVTTKYSYGSYNRLSSIGKVNFTYDGNGNTHTIANGSNSWTYNYDYNNRLNQVQKNAVTVATYSYDGNGMLVQSAETNTQVYSYQGNNRIYAKNTGSGSVADYIYANGAILASVNGTTTNYYHEDALGSVRIVSTSTGSTLTSTNYRPYGPLYGATGSLAFAYTGKATDPATGLYYSNARWYDPASGRFMTEDSANPRPSVPLSLNRYIYAEDDPMTLVDPTGRFAIDGDLFVKGKPSDDPVLYLVAAPQVTPSVMVVPPPTPTASLSYPSVTPPNVPTDTSTNSVTTPPTSAFQPASTQKMLDEIAAGYPDNVLTSASNSYPSKSANSQASSSSSGSSDQSNNIFKDVGQQLVEDELQNKYPGIGPAIALLDGLIGAAGIVNQDVIDAQHGGLTTTDYVNTGILAGGVVVGAFVGPEATVAIWAFDGTLFDVGL